MNKEEIRQALSDCNAWIGDDFVYSWMSKQHALEKATITLDGQFTIKHLEAILAEMKMEAEAQPDVGSEE